MNIRPITFVDTWAFASILHNRFKDRFSGGGEGYDTLDLRSEAGGLPILAEWKTAKSLISRVALAAAPLFGGETPLLGECFLLRMKGGGSLPWSVRESDAGWLTLALAIVPAPGSWFYAGGESAVLPPGQLTYLNRGVLHSAVNFSQHSSITMVLDVCKPDDPMGDDL